MTTPMTRTEQDRRAPPRPSVAGPVVVSVVVHALLLVVLLTVALTIEPGARQEQGAFDEIVLAVEADRLIEPEPVASASLPSPPLESAVETGEAVGLSDLVGATAPSALPALGGGGGGGVGALLGGRTGGASGVSFAGLRTKRAQRVVYVVDGSGAMVTSLPFVLEELVRSVDRLGGGQRFAVVLFRNRPPVKGDDPGGRYDVFAAGDGSMLEANEQSKRALRLWASRLEPRGMSNPSDGLRRALSFEPDAVFLLARSIRRSGPSAGWGVGREEILAELEEANARIAGSEARAAVIKTIQFLDEDPTGTMQAIGHAHGSWAGEDGYTLLTLSALGNLSEQEPTGADLPTADARIDRAAAMLSSLSETGHDTAAIFGIGVETERRAAVREAGKALRTADRSDALDALALFVRARSRIILAAGGDRSQLADAIAGLESINEGGGDDVPAVVTLNLATALAMRDEGDDRPRAARLLATIGDDLDPTSRAELLMTQVEVLGWEAAEELQGALAGEPFRGALGVDGALSAAGADVLAKLAEGESNPELARAALAAWAGLIRDPSLPRDATLARAAQAASGVGGEGLPPEVAYAVGRAALRGEIERDDTIELFEALSQDPAAPGWVRREALRDSGSARVARWEETGDAADAIAGARRLLRYVQVASGAADRARVLRVCLGVCERVMQADVGAERLAAVERVYVEAAEAAVRVLPKDYDRSDRWVCAYARSLLTKDAHDPAARVRALMLLDGVGAASEQAEYAAALRVHARVLNARELLQSLAEARAGGDEGAVRVTAMALLDECDRASGDAAIVGGSAADELAADRADAMVELGSTGAAALYSDLLQRNAAVPGGEARLRLGLARAVLGGGDAVGAFAQLRDLAERLNAPTADGRIRADEFWHAWTIMLELSAGRGRSVRAHAAGLAEIDPELGGRPWRSRIRSAAGLD